MTTTYQIRINGELYESSRELSRAESLFLTVDRTCLQSYHGKKKSLVRISDGKESLLKEGIIRSHRKGIPF